MEVLRDLRKIMGLLFNYLNSLIPIYVYIGTISLLFFYFGFTHYQGVNEVGIKRNKISGDLSIYKTPGLYISMPWEEVSKISTKPIRVCIECGCTNITCKLVSFNPDGWLDFVKKEGFKYYWWVNRFSFNSAHKDEYRGIEDILKGYSFDGVEYTFLEIHKNI